jgi:hypothetical protein
MFLFFYLSAETATVTGVENGQNGIEEGQTVNWRL